ncbi:MAG: acyl-CoA dehydrogenase family protein, partial [Pseudomonadota bacterium]
MDFNLGEEKELFRKMVSKFGRQEIAPLIEKLEETDEFPIELFKKMGKLGFLGVPYPEKYGGSGGDTITFCILTEEVAYVSVALAVCCLVQTLGVSGPVYDFGTEEQKEKFLIPSIKADKIGAIAMTEPEAGSDVSSIRTVAKKDRNGDYIINGTKMFCTMGGVADLYFVTAVTNPEKGIKGISLFVVERGTSGVTVSANIKKLGLHGAGTVELAFEDCRVSKNTLLGEEDRGFYNLMKTLERNRIIIG